jgi:predicted RND superfamily exporter protein
MKNMDSNKRTSWIDVVMNYPRLIIGSCLLITLLMGWNIPGIVIDSDIKSMLPEDQEIIVATNELEEIFGGSEIVILSVESDDIFSQSTLSKLQQMTDEVEALPIVDRVLSLTNAFELHSIADGFEVRDLIEKIPGTEEERTTLRQRIMGDEMLYGNIVSKDFRYTAVMAILSVTKSASDDEITYDTFHALERKYSGPEKIYVAGLPLTRKAITMTMQSDMKALFPFGIALMIFLLVFSFRSWVGAFLPFIVVIMSVVNTLGLMALLHIKFTFVSVMLPVMLIAIANDYSIHIIAYYFEECRSHAGLRKRDIIQRTIRHLKTPVLLAGITTIIGFLSLQSHILAPARQMGLLSSFGISVALLLSISFVPAVLMLLDVPVILQRGANNQLMNRWLAG